MCSTALHHVCNRNTSLQASCLFVHLSFGPCLCLPVCSSVRLSIARTVMVVLNQTCATWESCIIACHNLLTCEECTLDCQSRTMPAVHFASALQGYVPQNKARMSAMTHRNNVLMIVSVPAVHMVPCEGRLIQLWMYNRNGHPDDNHYAHPLDFIPVVDLNLKKVWLRPKKPVLVAVSGRLNYLALTCSARRHSLWLLTCTLRITLQTWAIIIFSRIAVRRHGSSCNCIMLCLISGLSQQHASSSTLGQRNRKWQTHCTVC